MKKSKLSELVLFIAAKSKDDPNFGMTKLNKILFFADFYYYGLTGKPISDSKYQHLNFGPAPIAMKPVLDYLQESGRAEIVLNDFHGHNQERLKPIDGHDLSLFTEEEIEYVSYWIDQLWHKNATDLTRETHELNPWLLSRNGEEIPFYTVFGMYDMPVEIEGHIWAREKLGELRQRGYAY